MARNMARDWLWSEACEMLARAERMHREVPGVDPDSIQAAIEDGDLVIAGIRSYPAVLRTAVIHRLELPQGRFFRRVRLPAGRYSTNVGRAVAEGCLVITLQKTGARSG